jgi:hypothetical protein
MSTQIQRRRGTTAEHSTFTGVEGELTVDTTKDTAVVHDGTTVGGHPLQKQYPPLGSAAAPTYTFTGDTNTGIYSPGADQVAVSTGGTGRLFVDANGNVGLGTATTNWSLLDGLIVQTGNGYAGINIASSSATDNAYLAFGYGTTAAEQFSASIGRVGNNTLVLGTNNAERVRITSAGLVGIGTSSPTATLDCNGSIRAISTTPIIPSSGTGLEIYYASGTFTGTPSAYLLSYDRTGSAYRPINIDASEHVFRTTGNEKARLDSSGRLLVGTSSSVDSALIQFAGAKALSGGIPQNQLNINDTTAYAAGVGGAIGFSGKYHSAGSITTFGSIEGIKENSTDGDYGGGLLFRTRANGDNNTERMRITSGGNVGIGTTSPGHKLDLLVGGGADGVNVYNNATGAAYYQLATTSRSYKIEAIGADLRFYDNTGSTERARIDASGRLLVGTSSARSNVYRGASSLISSVQIDSNANSYSNGINVLNYSGSGYGSVLTLGLSLSNTQGTNTVVRNNDELGYLNFVGNDGTNFRTGAWIGGEVDGTPGAGDMPGRLVFSTTADGASTPTERMRISSDGKVGINQTNTAAAAETLQVVEKDATNGYCIITSVTGTGDKFHLRFLNANGVVGSIKTSGSATSYNTSSDYRLKENVTTVTNSITRLQQLKPSRFNFIADPTKTVDGFIAHEVQVVVPEAITGEKDAVDEDGNPQYQGIDQSKLVPLLTAALQEAIAKIETLEGMVAVNNITIDEQQHQLSTLAARLTALENA